MQIVPAEEKMALYWQDRQLPSRHRLPLKNHHSALKHTDFRLPTKEKTIMKIFFFITLASLISYPVLRVELRLMSEDFFRTGIERPVYSWAS